MDSLLVMDHRRKIPNNEDSALYRANKIKESIVYELVKMQVLESGQKLGPIFSLIIDETVKGDMKCRKEFSDLLADIVPATALNRKKSTHVNYFLQRKADESIEKFNRRLADCSSVVTGDGVARQKPYFDLGDGILRGGENE